MRWHIYLHIPYETDNRDIRMLQFVSECCVIVSHIGVNCGPDPLSSVWWPAAESRPPLWKMVQCSGVIKHFTQHTTVYIICKYMAAGLSSVFPFSYKLATYCILHVFHLRAQAVQILVLHKKFKNNIFLHSIDGHFWLMLPMFSIWMTLKTSNHKLIIVNYLIF